ncbi:DNA polymerase III subunit gamma/tau [Xylophilus sp. GOD-11R]|uniref:DNA polymerase III subunit gamma/tau n=1 Tax=Xylophilus sp. GOD-11R TaxID=3089814 RepID=UPI00298C33A1|nr:DNA polymerase III subunit gamma/tau [Xylophilus sp. GOD-11R]WPB58737.1 DNA polymerase III subunit gamma/tau [Xylophilus sp. GOD-11R]
MSYLVLARKYRSRNFSEMVGQEHVVQALSNALQTQRLHHAYLFTGTRGVGKTTVSRILAKALNCTGPDGTGGITDSPCGVCQACRDIDAGRFVDYTELDAASNRGVDEVQSLLEQAVYKPVAGRFKVFMIDEVHMLTNTAFNAMLKTLEEPPEYLKFVLATTDPQKVPVTVLSRCLQFNLRPMAPETVETHLADVLGRESVPADAQAMRLLARAARGSMRDALSLTDQAIAFGGGEVREETVRRMLGSVDRSHVFRLIEALAMGDGLTVVETVEALRANGLSAASTLEDMAAVLQSMAVMQAVPQRAAAPADAEAAETVRLADTMPADETQLLYSICIHGRGELGLAPDEYAALTMVLLRLLAFKPASDAASTEKKTLKVAQRPVDAPSAAVAAPVEKPVPATIAEVPVPAPVVVAPSPAEPAAVAEPEVTESLSVDVDPDGDGDVVVPAQDVAEPVTAVEVARSPVESTPPVAPVDAAPAATSPASARDDNEPPPFFEDGDPGEADSSVPAPQSPPSRPPLAALPVRESGPGPVSGGAGRAESEAEASDVLSVPVRQQPLAGPRTGPRADVAAPAATFTPTAEGEAWYDTVRALVRAEAITALVRELALQSQLLARDGAHWMLRVESASLNTPNTRERLRAALAAGGHADMLSIEVGTVVDSPARRNAAAAAARQRQAEEIVTNDPFVQEMMRDFGAKIVPGSLKVRPLQDAGSSTSTAA